MELEKIKQNEPYLLKVQDQENQYFVVIEREIAMETTGCLDAMINMICSYYVFDINYPTQLYPILLFVQQPLCVCVCVCVCPPLSPLITSGMIWCDIDWLCQVLLLSTSFTYTAAAMEVNGQK